MVSKINNDEWQINFLEQPETLLPDEIDVCKVAYRAMTALTGAVENASLKAIKLTKAALISGTLVLTNSFLTFTVGTLKLTGCSIISVFAIKYLTNHFHQANVSLAKHGASFLKSWAERLKNEHDKITQEEAVFSCKNGRVFFSIKNYKLRLQDSFKAIVAPFSLTFSAINISLWLAAKPLYLAFIVPGFLADEILTAPLALNKEFSKLTYSPLKKVAFEMYDHHTSKLLPEAQSCLDVFCCSDDD